MNQRNSQFLCVAYDVSDNQRRTKLHKTLKRFGTLVQYSIFECWLTDTQLAVMQIAIARLIEEGDSIRYYELCSACHRQTITLGNAETTRLKHTYIF